MGAAFRPARLALRIDPMALCATSDFHLPLVVVRECHVTVPEMKTVAWIDPHETFSSRVNNRRTT